MKKDSPPILCARIGVAVVFALFCSVAVTAQIQTQDTTSYLVSAKAGRVNALSGKATVQHSGSAKRNQLTLKSELDSGDTLRTEAGARTELLLNPGSYLRIAENSEIELTDASLDNLRIKVVRGSAIVEATGTDGTRLLAEIKTPQTKILIDRNGLYRFNVIPVTSTNTASTTTAATTEVLVYKGRAVVGSNTLATVKGGSKIIVGSAGGAQAAIAKLDKKNQDDFDFWSRERAGGLMAANRRLTGGTITNVLTSYRNNGAYGYGYAPYFGLWVFDASFSGYTFLPFYSRWSSPYGFGYQNNFGIPWGYYRPVSPLPNSGSNGGNNNGFITNPPVAGVPVAPSPGRPDPIDPDNPEPIRNHPIRPVRPMPVGENAELFDQALRGSGGGGIVGGNSIGNSDRMSGASTGGGMSGGGNNNSGSGGSNGGGMPAASAPVRQERMDSPSPSEPVSRPERNVQPGRAISDQ
ncbi:MAG: FecR domain-containing protein [Pyrinomonadaceae bacterium]